QYWNPAEQHGRPRSNEVRRRPPRSPPTDTTKPPTAVLEPRRAARAPSEQRATPEPRTAATSAPRNLDARTPAHGAPHQTPTPPRHCKTNTTAMRTHKPDPQTTHADPTPRMHTTPDPRTMHATRAHDPGPTNDARRPHARPRP
ncbi:hypothetical protein DXG01_015928, partial [Tephrocybe rancida]